MTQIPIIEASRLNEPSTIQELVSALHEWGFFYIKNHTISEALPPKILSDARSFFAEDEDFKMLISMKKAGLAWRGYFPVGGELTSGKPDQKEGIYFGRESEPGLPLHGANLWPTGEKYSEFKKSVLKYMHQLTDLGQNLMTAVGVGLGLDKNYFRGRFTSEPTTLFRIFNYPVADQKQIDEWGVREHTDMGFLTILLQDGNPGLQIKTKKGDWIAAPPIENTFVVNIGDMLEVWTHGLYRATAHRVRNEASVDRISVPFFFDPNWNSSLEPIPVKDFSPENQKHLKALAGSPLNQRWDGLQLRSLSKDMTYGEFVWNKVKKVFPDLAKQ